MAGSSKDNGRITRCMVKESFHGGMVESILESTLKIKNMAKALSTGNTTTSFRKRC